MVKMHHLSDAQKEAIVNAINDFLIGREEVAFAFLHGSFVESFSFRDIDVALYVTDEKLRKDNVFDYECAITFEMGKKVNLPLDVKVLKFCPLGFRYQVTKGKALAIRHKEIYFDYLEHTWLHYLDLQYYNKEMLFSLLSE